MSSGQSALSIRIQRDFVVPTQWVAHGFSVVAHVAFFLLLISLNVPTSSSAPVPRGVEWVEFDGPVSAAAPRAQPKTEKIIQPKPLEGDIAVKRKKSETPPAPAENNPAPAAEASQATVTGTGSSGVRGPEGRTDGVEVSAEQRYIYEFRMMLERRKVFPEAARRRRLNGRVLVEVELRPDGTYKELKIAGSSNHEVLDDATLKLFQKVEGQKPFPDEVRRTSWRLTVPVDFVTR